MNVGFDGRVNDKNKIRLVQDYRINTIFRYQHNAYSLFALQGLFKKCELTVVLKIGKIGFEALERAFVKKEDTLHFKYIIII